VRRKNGVGTWQRRRRRWVYKLSQIRSRIRGRERGVG